MKTISISLPDPLHKKLTAAAKKRGVKRSALARDALANYLQVEPGSLPKGSFLELGKDFIGSVEGPGDLSYNKKYLDDYGR